MLYISVEVDHLIYTYLHLLAIFFNDFYVMQL